MAYKDRLRRRDDDLFRTARLVTCGLYAQILVHDYVRTILNLQRVDSGCNLDPRMEYGRFVGQTKIENSGGNQVSSDLNLMYRWHSTISAKDEQWLQQHITGLLPNVNAEDMTVHELYTYMHRFALQQPSDPSKRTWAGLQRKPGGCFNDTDLARILTAATEDTAASFGPRQIPVALKAIEVMGIRQARARGVASLNEVRRHFRMNAHKAFSDINSDPDIAATLQNSVWQRRKRRAVPWCDNRGTKHCNDSRIRLMCWLHHQQSSLV